MDFAKRTGSVDTSLMSFLDNGNVGIATTSPAYMLDVVGTGRFAQPVIVGTPVAANQAATKNYVDSAVSGGSSSGSFATINVGGVWTLSGAAQSSLNVNGNNITGVNKLTAIVIDPVYVIGTKRYATYLPAMTGVKEETDGLAELTKSGDGIYRYVIDFASLPSGSDLWLFAHATNIEKHLDDLMVTETPSVDGTVWYEKDFSDGRLTLDAKPDGTLGSTMLEVTYRLIAPRFDAAQWPNTSTDYSSSALTPPQ